MLREFKAPNQIDFSNKSKSIFLAGTIDNGNSENWQEYCVKFYKELREDIDIYNPKRDDWNSKLDNSYECPEFYQQVNWELDALNKADKILMYFLPKSESPITLLELGLFASSGKIHVCCPDEFWRAGNVQIICNNYNIPMYKDLKNLLTYTRF